MSPLVRLNPAPPPSTPTYNNNPAITLTVRDTRPAEILGTLPIQGNQPAQPTKAVVSVEEVVRQHVTAALTRAGFQVLQTPTEKIPNLDVEIKRLDFKLERAATWSEISGGGSLSVTTKVGSTTRTKTYNAENGQKWGLSPPLDGHEKFLNGLLSDMFNAFLTDHSFLTFLATGS